METHQLRSELAHIDRVVTISTLTSALAHEINQPLAAMRSYAQAALRFMDKDYPEYESVRKALQGIVADNKRAAEVVNRLRNLVKKGTPNREMIEINSIINDVKDLINSELVLRNTSITLNLNPGIPVIQSDSIQIQQVLINLLTNALDAMNDKPIDARTIVISTRAENSSEIIVSISDSGTGIPPDSIERIFLPFHTTKSTGMGLGLSICKSIIEAHGGRISRPQTTRKWGATFSFNPADRKSNQGNLLIWNENMRNRKPIVFVVDDDPSIRESLSLLLNSAGYKVETFASAKEFLESDPSSSGPACLVSDVKMPGLSGLDLQKELKSKNCVIPIIFITGHGDIPMSVQAMKKGAVDFLPKPFDDNDLLDAVKEALLKDSQTRADLDDQKHILQRLDSLTTREHEILTYLITGMLNKQIAYELNISERTVKAHRKQVFDKMGVNSIAELVRLTETLGIKPANVSF